MNEIKPALTADEWAEVLQHGDSGRYYDTAFDTCGPKECHYLAALALNGQPFGFTWDDWMGLYMAASILRSEADHEAVADVMAVMEKIAALLPPEGAPQSMINALGELLPDE